MKKIEILVDGQFEEEIGLEIMQGVYAAINNHGYTDVSVNAMTQKPQRELLTLSFMTQNTGEGMV